MRRLPQIILSIAGIASALIVLTAAPASAQISGDCTATVAGQDVRTATSPASAIEVGHEDVVRIEGTDPSGAPYTKIALRFRPLPGITVYDEDHDPPDPTWGGEIQVADYAKWGVGLYQVSGSTDDCTGTAWIKVTGRSPFTTLAGGIGTAIALAGAIGGVVSVVRATPGWGSFFRSLSRGAVLGLGLAVIAQQTGLTPLTGGALLGWIGAAGSTMGLGNVGVSTLRAGASAAAGVG